MKSFYNLLSLFFTFSAFSIVEIDTEFDPVPLIEISVTIPMGTFHETPHKKVAANFFADIFDYGSNQIDRKAFKEKLAAFGATQSLSSGPYYTQWSLEFPFIQEKNYQELIDLLKEHWESPRFKVKEFELIKKQKLSGLHSSLESDYSTLSSSLRKILLLKSFGIHSANIEDYERLRLEDIVEHHAKLKKIDSAWASYLGPKEQIVLTKKIILEVFPQFKKAAVRKRKKVLKSLSKKEFKMKPIKNFILIDKAGQNQNIIELYMIRDAPLKKEQEINRQFSHHVLTDSGLDAVVYEELRGKSGLAYSVSSVGDKSLERAVLGFLSNPQQKKQKKTFEVFEKLYRKLYLDKSMLDDLKATQLEQKLTSMKNAYILQNATPSSRLALRRAVVTDQISQDYLEKSPQKWKSSLEDIKNFMASFQNKSSILLGAVGDKKNLAPLIQKHFPEFKIITIPYKKSIHEATYSSLK